MKFCIKQRILFLTALWCSYGYFTLAIAQQPLPAIGKWRMHASFSSNSDLIQVDKQVYVGSNNAMFTYDTENNEIEIFSRVNGLSDVSVAKMDYDPATRTIIIGYDGGNIDLVTPSGIRNIPDIFNRIIVGDKRINEITIHNGRAYFACSFGVVVVDMRLRRIVDSYQDIGPGGTRLDVLDVAIKGDSIYIASSNAIYRSSLRSSNLSDFNNWQLFRTAANIRAIETFQNKLYLSTRDSVWYYDAGIWNVFSELVGNQFFALNSNAGKLLFGFNNKLSVLHQNGQIQDFPSLIGARAASWSSDGYIYAIIDLQGMLRIQQSGGDIEYISPSGPYGSFAKSIKYHDKKLWMAGDGINGLGVNSGWASRFSGNKNYLFADNIFTNFKGRHPSIDAASDIIDVAINPLSGNAFFAGFGHGVIEMNEEGVVNVFTEQNSTLQRVLNNDTTPNVPVQVAGVSFDSRGNLWVTNPLTQRPLSVRTTNGVWQSFNLPTNVDRWFGGITCDDFGNKWIFNTRGNGLVVFRENNLNSPNDDEVKVLNTERQNGGLPSNLVFCVTNDRRSEIWVGTSTGLCIFTNPQNVFRANTDFDARQIVVRSGSIFTNFLDEVPVYAITVDAANRKWLGTGNGAWLVSPDGQTVIHHFTRRNSPLPSDLILAIGINEHTGEVFFSTDRGMVSWIGNATTGQRDYQNVRIFPNPVKPGYDGEIAIQGLVENSFVKITDLSGALVSEMRSNGGATTWNGTNMNGNPVPTGVYLVFATDRDGVLTHVDKIMLIR
jgi:hypothetical protein